MSLINLPAGLRAPYAGHMHKQSKFEASPAHALHQSDVRAQFATLILSTWLLHPWVVVHDRALWLLEAPQDLLGLEES